LRNSTIVLCITGNGLKTQEVLNEKSGTVHVIDPSISAFDKCFMLD